MRIEIPLGQSFDIVPLLCKAEEKSPRPKIISEPPEGQLVFPNGMLSSTLANATYPTCDCGAEKTNTTHSPWCSSSKGIQK
jgi:hypothetical protein